MKSRHLLALATGACLGLAGLGQTAFADRGKHDDENRSRECSADHKNSSENEIGDSEQDGLLSLIGLGGLGVNGISLGALNNTLCGADIAILSDDDRKGDHKGDHKGDRKSDGECSADHKNRSENELGDSEQDGLLSLIGLGGVGVNGIHVGALNNTLCGADIAILSDDDRKGDRKGGPKSDVECSADHENKSDNEMGDADQDFGLLSLIGLNSLGLNGTSAGLLNNTGCGSSIAILSGGLGLF